MDLVVVAACLFGLVLAMDSQTREDMGGFFSDIPQQAQDELTRDDLLWLGPIGGVVVGAFIALLGQTLVEQLKSRRERRIANDQHRLDAYTELVQTWTRLTQGTNERAKLIGLSSNGSADHQGGFTKQELEELTRQAQIQIARARLLTPTRRVGDHLAYELETMELILSQLDMDRDGSLMASRRDRMVEAARYSLGID